ncbi:transcription initiation factor TFIID subunit 10 isoform X3 [Syzygium oleosum]|uniref:transcription initiation factor TFIID subunit 10 isoform X3 n=1 Tax=Syzygium oleosum TaxID=219896 RepID=UPI0024BB324D|nr:transcription initiation factor TFIID subunit 10 isoform X3 [Syzygium oleosum]
MTPRSPISSPPSWSTPPLCPMSWWSTTWGRAGSSVLMSDCRTRLVAVATQKFVADIASDALQHCKARQASIVKDKRDKQQKDKRLILTMDDLSKALREMIDDKLPFIFPFSVWCQCEAPGVLRRQSFGWVGYCH